MTNKELFSEQEGTELIYKLVDNLKTGGFLIDRYNINSIIFIDSPTDCGHMLFATETAYDIAINKKLLNRSKFNYLICAIYHELAHIIQHNEAIAANIIKYNKTENTIDIICGDVELANYLIFNNCRHTKLWFDIINEINTKYNLVPKITDYLSQDELDKFLEGFFMTKLQIENKPHVDTTISGLTIDDMMKYDVKPEYSKTTVNESYEVKHDYRKLLQKNDK